MSDSLDFASVIQTHVVQFTIAIVLVGLIARLTARKWPRFTFLLCMLALVKCLIPPLISSPFGLFTMHDAVALNTFWTDTPSTPQSDCSSGLPAGANTALQQPCILLCDGVQLHTRESAIAARLDGRNLLQASWTSAPDTSTGASGSPFRLVLFVVWLLGACAMAGLAGVRWVRLQRQLRMSTELPPSEVSVLVTELSTQLGVTKNIGVVVSVEGFGPAVAGCVRPRLILPQSLIHDDLDSLRPIVAHELIHVRQRDTWWGLVQFAAQILWWFHPCVWWISHKASALCERCCDALVLNELSCTPGQYGASLLRVLETHQRRLYLPAVSQMSTREITAERLENLAECTPRRRWHWLMRSGLALALAAMMIPGDGHSGNAAQSTSEDDKSSRARRASKALESQDWNEAATQLQRIVKADDNDGRAWFYLGYALHGGGRLDEAIAAHARATEFEQYRNVALYNWACALALKGETDAAIEKLTEAIDKGFVHRSDIQSDTDLDSLHDHPDFPSLRQRAMLPRKDSPMVLRQFDFWVGDWEVVNDEGKFVGRNRITKDEQGYLITEKWTNSDGGTGTSINFYDPGEKKWKQTWVDATGNVIQYIGEFADGAMRMTGQFTRNNGSVSLSRLVLQPLPGGEISQLIEQSDDEGETWSTYFSGTYRSVNPSPEQVK